MVDTTNEDMIRSAVAAFNAGDVSNYLAYFAPSCQRWIAGFDQPLSLAEVAENLRLLVEAFEPLQLGEELLIADGDYVCARWQLRGVQVGEFMGLDSRSGHIDVATCEIYQVVHGQVISSWVYQDPGQLFAQMAAGSREYGHE
jgi:predicted ester cyclase